MRNNADLDLLRERNTCKRRVRFLGGVEFTTILHDELFTIACPFDRIWHELLHEFRCDLHVFWLTNRLTHRPPDSDVAWNE